MHEDTDLTVSVLLQDAGCMLQHLSAFFLIGSIDVEKLGPSSHALDVVHDALDVR